MRALVSKIDKLNYWLAGLSGIMLGLMTVLILVEIFLWNTIQKTTLIADEYSAYGLAAIVFLGSGYCLQVKGHIRITLVLVLLPKKLSDWITFFATGVTTVFMGYLWYFLYSMVNSTFRYNSTSGTLTNTPLWIPQSIMLFGAFCFLLQFVATTIKTYYAIGTDEEVV